MCGPQGVYVWASGIVLVATVGLQARLYHAHVRALLKIGLQHMNDQLVDGFGRLWNVRIIMWVVRCRLAVSRKRAMSWHVQAVHHHHSDFASRPPCCHCDLRRMEGGVSKPPHTRWRPMPKHHARATVHHANRHSTPLHGTDVLASIDKSGHRFLEGGGCFDHFFAFALVKASRSQTPYLISTRKPSSPYSLSRSFHSIGLLNTVF